MVNVLHMLFGKIYTFGPTFRAENSNTTKHAAEFWMIEPEVAFADLDEIMDTAEGMFKYIGKEVYLRGWVRNIRFSKAIRVYRIK